jgi:hypothetical protein
MDARLVAAGLVKVESAKPYGAYARVTLVLLGKPTEVEVLVESEADPAEPNEAQIGALVSLLASWSDFASDLEGRLLDYHRERGGNADTIAELAHDLALSGLVVGYHDGQGWSDHLGLLFNCAWDPEHGVGVKIVQNKVVEIASQDIII